MTSTFCVLKAYISRLSLIINSPHKQDILQARCPSCRPTSVKALNGQINLTTSVIKITQHGYQNHQYEMMQYSSTQFNVFDWWSVANSCSSFFKTLQHKSQWKHTVYTNHVYYATSIVQQWKSTKIIFMLLLLTLATVRLPWRSLSSQSFGK